jgi:hypothetical protein
LGRLWQRKRPFFLCAPIGFAGPLGRINNRGDRATARFEHIWKIAKLSFVSTMPFIEAHSIADYASSLSG